MDTTPDDARHPAKRLKPNDPTYVHVRLPLHLSTGLSDPVFIECQNVEFIRNNNPSNDYLLHISSLVLDIDCKSIRIRRRQDGRDAADNDLSWEDISEGDIKGGTYICDFEDGMKHWNIFDFSCFSRTVPDKSGSCRNRKRRSSYILPRGKLAYATRPKAPRNKKSQPRREYQQINSKKHYW
jgi:hypothetical protein